MFSTLKVLYLKPAGGRESLYDSIRHTDERVYQPSKKFRSTIVAEGIRWYEGAYVINLFVYNQGGQGSGRGQVETDSITYPAADIYNS